MLSPDVKKPKFLELQEQADAMKKKEQKDAIAEIKRLMSLFDISPSMLGIKVHPKRNPASRYKNPETGAIYGGYGKKPDWLKNHPNPSSLKISD